MPFWLFIELWIRPFIFSHLSIWLSLNGRTFILDFHALNIWFSLNSSNLIKNKTKLNRKRGKGAKFVGGELNTNICGFRWNFFYLNIYMCSSKSFGANFCFIFVLLPLDELKYECHLLNLDIMDALNTWFFGDYGARRILLRILWKLSRNFVDSTFI